MNLLKFSSIQVFVFVDLSVGSFVESDRLYEESSKCQHRNLNSEVLVFLTMSLKLLQLIKAVDYGWNEWDSLLAPTYVSCSSCASGSYGGTEGVGVSWRAVGTDNFGLRP